MSFVTGIRAAVAAARWVESGRLTELLVLRASPRGGREPTAAIAASRTALRALARVPGGRWRNTCLYRSVAEVLVLREEGIPAALCIGVKKDAASPHGVAAHAWVARTAEERQSEGMETMQLLTELRAQT